MAEYTIDEWWTRCRAQCDVREYIPAVVVAVSFPHGPGKPRFHVVFPEKVALEDGIAVLEQAIAQLKDRLTHRN